MEKDGWLLTSVKFCLSRREITASSEGNLCRCEIHRALSQIPVRTSISSHNRPCSLDVVPNFLEGQGGRWIERLQEYDYECLPRSKSIIRMWTRSLEGHGQKSVKISYNIKKILLQFRERKVEKWRVVICTGRGLELFKKELASFITLLARFGSMFSKHKVTGHSGISDWWRSRVIRKKISINPWERQEIVNNPAEKEDSRRALRFMKEHHEALLVFTERWKRPGNGSIGSILKKT